MTNPTQLQWEQAILNKLTNNGERIAVVENDFIANQKRLIRSKRSNQPNQITTGLAKMDWWIVDCDRIILNRQFHLLDS